MHNDKTITIPGLSVSFMVRPILGGPTNPWSEIETDLLTIDLHTHSHFGGGIQELDRFLEGALTRALEQQRFEGKVGEAILISRPSAKIQNVLVLGAGQTTSRIPACGLVALIVEHAHRLSAGRVTIPLFPGRLHELSLAGTMAVLRCRIGHIGSQPDGLANLKVIEILSTPQAKRWIVDGLTVSDSLCRSCSNPIITITRKVG